VAFAVDHDVEHLYATLILGIIAYTWDRGFETRGTTSVNFCTASLGAHWPVVFIFRFPTLVMAHCLVPTLWEESPCPTSKPLRSMLANVRKREAALCLLMDHSLQPQLSVSRFITPRYLQGRRRYRISTGSRCDTPEPAQAVRRNRSPPFRTEFIPTRVGYLPFVMWQRRCVLVLGHPRATCCASVTRTSLWSKPSQLGKRWTPIQFVL
jgi:hypothetical protein